MKRGKNTIIIVEGMSEFPIDMLRYDEVHPYQERDSYAISAFGIRRIRLIRKYDPEQPNWKPSEGRWESFHWSVIDVEYL